MSSNKRKDEIHKSVEESILDAVTRLKKDEASFDPFQGARGGAPANGAKNKQAEDELWDILNQKKIPEPPEFKILPEPLGPLGNGEQGREQGANSPIAATVAGGGKGDSTLLATKGPVKSKPMAFGPSAKANSDKVPPPSFDFTAENLEKLNSVQLKIYEGDHMKIAQQRIDELEKENVRLRLENDRLASATELFQKRGEESLRSKQELEKKHQHLEQRSTEERAALKAHLEERDQLIKELKEKVEVLETRLSNDIRKSRTRERELENRLELARLERISLVGAKDEIILDLKRQVDQLNHELGNYRRKTADMNQTIEANQEQFRRTVRALRLALTNLEVNEQIGGRSKKAE